VKTIRELREAQNMTQLELAIKLGVTPTTVYNWEAGRSVPKVEQLRKLAEVFAVRMDDIHVERTVIIPRKKQAA
jgi:putative transcriptional regulator